VPQWAEFATLSGKGKRKSNEKAASDAFTVLAKTNTQEDTIMLERALIDHGSPTLANMKVGSLFTSSCADATGSRAELWFVKRKS